MTDRNEALRRCITVTLAEIEAAYKNFGYEAHERMDFLEAMQVIERIEAKLKRRASDARDVAVEDHDGR